MKERPILFSAPMVRALLDGSKTQTRRIMKVQPDEHAAVTVERYYPTVINRHGDDEPGHEIFGAWWADGECGLACPYGQPGDRLWVKETHWRDDEDVAILYAADPNDFEIVQRNKIDTGSPRYNWKPSIHMPRVASRITLEIVSVRVERLQDISEADAKAEGCDQTGVGTGRFDANGNEQEVGSYSASYYELWQSINGPGSWSANPRVWVVEFKVVKP